MSPNPARTCLSNNLYLYHHRIVRDLLWSLCSPSLIAKTLESGKWLGDDWFNELILELLEPLAALDADPSALLTELEEGRDRRLGHTFETLIAHAFRISQRYQLLEKNILIKDGSRTLGELDILVRDIRDNKTIHLEVAVKFYLAIDTGKGTYEWLGPNPVDRLPIKKRGMEQQLERSLSPEAGRWLQERGIVIDERHATMKGRLFYPLDSSPETGTLWINPNLPRNWWSDHEGFQQYRLAKDLVWVTLDKSDWLSPLTPHDATRPFVFPDPAVKPHSTNIAEHGTSHPVCIAGLRNGYEIERGFIVPQHWPHIPTQ